MNSTKNFQKITYDNLIKTLKSSQLLGENEFNGIANNVANSTEAIISKEFLTFFIALKKAFENLSFKLKNLQYVEEKKRFGYQTEEDSSLNDEEILKDGLNLLLMLRQLITGESLKLFVGGEIKDSGGNRQLYTQEYSYEDIVKDKNFYFDFEKGAFYFNKALYDFKQNLQSGPKLYKGINFWDGIRKWAYVDITHGNSTYYKYSNVFKKRGQADFNVFLKIETDKKNHRHFLYYYYLKTKGKSVKSAQQDLKKTSHNDYMFYNTGWLLQWYREQERNNELVNSYVWSQKNSKIPLFEFMSKSKMDNLPGVRGGDVYDEQVKFQNNRKIMSLKNLRNIIEGKSDGLTKNENCIGIIPTLNNIIQKSKSLQGGLEDLYKDYVDLTKAQIQQLAQNQVSNLIQNLFS